jgi:alanyl-tRNA synthetase
MNYKSGVRVSLQIGRKAFEDYCQKNASVYAISNMLCAKTEEVADSVEKLQLRLKEADFRYNQLKKELFAEKSKNWQISLCKV